MEESQDTNVASKVKVASAVLLVAIVTAAGVGLLVQHRKLDELRKARASLENSNLQLSVGREELVSANGKLAEELRALRDVGRAHASDQAVLDKERTAWKTERVTLFSRLASVEASLKAAREAQSRAEAEVARLKATVKDMAAVEKKLRAEREKFRIERNRLEHELNDAMEPAAGADDVPTPALSPIADADDVAVPIPPAPPMDKRTPEERAAHEKKELNDLIGL